MSLMSLFFENESERHQRLHDQGEKDASTSESTILGETNCHTPAFGFSETERADNAAYRAGFENGVKQRND